MGGAAAQRPAWVRRVAAMGPNVGGAEHLVPLDADELIATARRSTGLDDFGPSTWEEPFRRLLTSLADEADLHALGRLQCRNDLLRHLRTRLQVVEAHRADPAVGEREVVAPVFVTGPARSGTSILHELLAEDPRLRAPLAWEMAHPVPPPPGAPDERAAWAESEFDLWADIHPPFAAVHELQATLPEECIWLVAPEFDLAFWSTCTNTPGFAAWRSGSDPDPVYRWHRRMLQVLQGEGPQTWVLKSPAHMNRLAALFAVYPDARIIHTHRDPVRTLPSVVSTLVAGRRVRSDAVDPAAIAAGLRFGMPHLMQAVVDQRAAGVVPEAQIADLHYLDLLRDPVDAIRRAYAHLGMDFADDLPGRITAYLAARPQDKHGVHRYAAADHGFDVEELRTAFAPYTDAFGVEPEPV